MADKNWTKLHSIYKQSDWATRPSIFAEAVKDYLPKTGTLLELGAGLGQDSVYFSELGYQVTATDLDITHLQNIAAGKFIVELVDLRKPLPFDESSFDVVYAHLSLHYFDQKTTENIFSEISRVLKRDGILAFFTNSTSDSEYNKGPKIESDYFDIDGTPKRYLNVESALQFAHSFKPLVADNNGETYKDSAKGIHHLIRFVGMKV